MVATTTSMVTERAMQTMIKEAQGSSTMTMSELMQTTMTTMANNDEYGDYGNDEYVQYDDCGDDYDEYCCYDDEEYISLARLRHGRCGCLLAPLDAPTPGIIGPLVTFLNGSPTLCLVVAVNRAGQIVDGVVRAMARLRRRLLLRHLRFD